MGMGEVVLGLDGKDPHFIPKVPEYNVFFSWDLIVCLSNLIEVRVRPYKGFGIY